MRPFLIAAALLAGPGFASAQGVTASRAWARASPPGQDVASAYVTLTSAAADRLTGVSTPAGQATLHTMTMNGAVMRMREISAVPLPAGQPVTLGPAADHIMLEHLTHPLRAGQTFTLHLTFAHAPPLDVPVPVERLGARGPGS